MVKRENINGILFGLLLLMLATEAFSSLAFLRWGIEALVILYFILRFFHPTFAVRLELIGAVKVQSESSGTVSESVIELSETLGYEADIINQELDRVEGLVKDAVQLMTESFHNVLALSEQQKSLAEEAITSPVISNAHPLAPEAGNAVGGQAYSRELGEKICRLSLTSADMCLAVDDAVRALQFEDMATQAIQSIHYNVNTIRRISELVPGLILPDGTVDDEIAEQLHGLCLELKEATKKRNSTRAVSQSSLDEGDVELF